MAQNKPNPTAANRWTTPLALVIYFALVKLLIHLLTNGQYGYFRDELYFLATGDHLDWGYVDMPPMAALAAWFSRHFLGDSLFAIRFLPALAGALKVVLAGLMVIEFGGKRFAVILASLCIIGAPIYLAQDTLLSMNAFEPLFWMGSVYFIILAINRNDSRFLLGFGVLAGLGLENKHSMLFFGFGIVVGLLLTPQRRYFAGKWLWIAGAIALAIFMPNIIWQIQHDWATIELLNNVRITGKNVVLSPADFIIQQFILLNPLTAPVWLAGLWYFFFDAQGKRYRLLGIAYLVTLVVMIALEAKNYYLMPAYLMLFAGGAVLWEQLLQRNRRFGWVKVAYPALIVAGGLILAPMALPILPVETYLSYQETLNLTPPKTEVGHVGPLPQYYGDMFGWPEMVETVADVYHNLPPDEQDRAAIFASNYGEAGAIDLFGPDYGLPKAISTHQNYYLWGPGDYSGEVMIVLQVDRQTAEQNCGSVEEAGSVGHPYAMSEEHYTIYICRDLKQPLAQIWPEWKFWR